MRCGRGPLTINSYNNMKLHVAEDEMLDFAALRKWGKLDKCSVVTIPSFQLKAGKQ